MNATSESALVNPVAHSSGGTRHVTKCSTCSLSKLCIPSGLGETEVAALDELVAVRRRISKGASLVNAGDQFHNIYAIRSGSFKGVVVGEEGQEQITGFSMAGDVIGLDGIDTDRHTLTITSLEDSEVCTVPFAPLQRLGSLSPNIQRQVFRIFSREIGREHSVMLLLGTMTSDQRIATFILSLSQRFALRGFSPLEFNFRMSRIDIGSYLGLTIETVSRSLSRFQEKGIISVRQRELSILQMEQLKALSGL